MPWKVDLKSRAFARRAVHPDISVALLHHAIHGRETEARALSYFLGGKERLEDMRDGLGAHAGPRVCDRKHHVTSYLGAGMIVRVRKVEFYVSGLDLEFPAQRHCVARIHSQV